MERSGSPELAYAFNGTWGVEAFVPIRGLNVGQTLGPLGIGDLEIDPIKYSFWQAPDFIMTARLAKTLPTGDVAQGLGEGRVIVVPHLLIDRANGRWAWHINVAVSQHAALRPPPVGGGLNVACWRFDWSSFTPGG